MMKKLIIVVSLFVLVAVTYLSFALISQNPSFGPNVVREIKDSSDESAGSTPEQGSPEELEENSVGNAGFEGGGAGGAGGGEPGEYVPNYDVDEDGCILSPISYTLGGIQESSTCIEYNNQDCIKKVIGCAVSLQNLDAEISGDFTIGFSFLNAKSKELLETSSQSKNLAPNQQEIFEASTELQDESAALEVTCSYQMLEVPVKHICPN